MATKPNKLKWKRVGNSHNLELISPETVNISALKKLFAVVEETESCGKHFSQETSSEFNRWLQNLDTPLKEQAYARLSNWFLCGMKYIPKTDLGIAARNFWDALFCTIPEKRLTKPEKNHKILCEEFALWWPKQLRCQEDR